MPASPPLRDIPNLPELSPAELLILRAYRTERRRDLDRGVSGDSLTYAQRPAGHNGKQIRVNFYAARKCAERTGVRINRVVQLLWKIHLAGGAFHDEQD